MENNFLALINQNHAYKNLMMMQLVWILVLVLFTAVSFVYLLRYSKGNNKSAS